MILLYVWVQRVDHFLKENKIGIDDLGIALFPRYGNKKRELDIGNFIKLIDRMDKEIKKVEFVVFGDIKNTKEIKNILIEKCLNNVIDGVGKTTLRQIAALIQKMNFYIGDTGPMHLAVACRLKGVYYLAIQ